MQQLLDEVPPRDKSMDVVVLGSIARREASSKSDFDYLVVAHSLPSKGLETARLLVASADRLPAALQLKPPGRTGMFGKVIAAADLTERIGLEQDTNTTHSRRVLLLEESASIYQPDLHRLLTDAIIERYTHELEEGTAVARFLMNDVVRYWRTMAVDYQAKRWESTEGWGLRYLKLLVSRKLTYAGTLVSLLLPEQTSSEYLSDQFAMPPLARLAQLHRHLEPALNERLGVVLMIAEEFSELLEDDDFRTELEVITKPSDASPGSRFSKVRDQARELESHLEALFFDSQLGPRSREYLAF